MKLVEGFRLRQLGGEFIVTPESVAQINFNKLISLNSSAATCGSRLKARSSPQIPSRTCF